MKPISLYFAGAWAGTCSSKETELGVTNKLCSFLYPDQLESWLKVAEGSPGKILIDDEARNIETTISLSNRVVGEKQIRQAERNFIDFNMMLSLPKNTGVLFGNGLAKVATVYPVVVEKHADTKMVMHFEEDDTPKKLDSGSTLIFPELS